MSSLHWWSSSVSRGCHLYVRVEVFATEIRIESSDQTPFQCWSKARSPLNCKNQECVAAFWPLTRKKSALKGTIKRSSTLLADQKSWSHFKSRHDSDYPLSMCTVLSFAVISFSMQNLHVMAVHWKQHSHSPHQKLHQRYLHCGIFTSLLVILQTLCICRKLQTFIGIWLHHILLLFVVT